VPPFLPAVNQMPHRIQINHDLGGVLGQATHPQLHQTRFDPGRLVRQLVATGVPVVGQLQPVERGRSGQGQTPMARIETVLPQGILFVASRGQQRIPPQLRVIVDIFAAQRQPVNALRQQLPHRVIDEHRLALVPKALGQ
jgi:hypothetical protein